MVLLHKTVNDVVSKDVFLMAATRQNGQVISCWHVLDSSGLVPIHDYLRGNSLSIGLQAVSQIKFFDRPVDEYKRNFRLKKVSPGKPQKPDDTTPSGDPHSILKDKDQ